MDEDTPPNGTLYQMFANSGPNIVFIGPAIFINLISLFGIPLNFSIILLSILSPSLRGAANFFLALISFFEIIHQLGHLLFLILALSGQNFIPLERALKFEFVPIFAINAALISITLTAFDRLFAILAEKIHCQLNKMVYLGIGTALSIFYGLFMASGFYISQIRENPYFPATGYIGDLLDGPFALIWLYSSATLNILAIFCYLIIWIVIKRKKEVSQNTNARLLKSLLLIVLVNIGGYFVDVAILQIVFTLLCPNCYKNAILGWELGFLNAILLNVGVASNAPILYFTSLDYRKAYQKNLFPKLCPSNNQVSTIQNGPILSIQQHSIIKIKSKLAVMNK